MTCDLPIPADHPLLADLTEPQQQAVVRTEGPLLVVAAAGSGKTRVITRRVAYLVQVVGIPPWQILAITFTNKAAGEMRDRVGTLVSERQARALTVCTFHSLCARLLREFAAEAGLPPGYSIYDTADQKRLIRQAYEELDINSKNFSPDSALSTISNAKNELRSPQAFSANAGNFYDRTMARVYEKYQRLLTANNAVDFDDLLMKLADLLRHSAEVRSACQQRYQYVLVDEYQDTNHAQFMIAHTLCAGHRNLCVVGDPDQSIYGWRGANIRNILEFEQHFPDAKVVALGQNWRSTPEILAAADALIRNNRQRRHKPLFTDNAGGSAIEIVHAADEEHEAELVVEYLRAREGEGLAWSDMAVFYRVNALSRTLEDRLMRSSIPYQVARGTAFYDRKEVKDAIAYLKVLANPADQVALERIINTPTRGIGRTSLDHLKAFAAANGLTLWDALADPRLLGQLPARTAKAVGKFTAMFDQWREQLTGDGDDPMFAGQPLAGVRQLVESVIAGSGLEAMYRKQDEEKLANLDELITAAQRFDEEYGEPEATLAAKVNDYLQAVALVSDVDAVDEQSGAVTLMTLHAAKGLEFGAVAMVGMEEGLLPHSRSLDNPSEMEEERRLCFVGITRACRHLMLSHARYRAIRGYRERTIPSQFLNELPQDVIEVRDAAADHDFADDRPSYGARSSRAGLPTGSLVRHPQFGVGTVEQVSGAGDSARARVKFASVGIKTLILQYARLERVE